MLTFFVLEDIGMLFVDHHAFLAVVPIKRKKMGLLLLLFLSFSYPFLSLFSILGEEELASPQLPYVILLQNELLCIRIRIFNNGFVSVLYLIYYCIKYEYETRDDALCFSIYLESQGSS